MSIFDFEVKTLPNTQGAAMNAELNCRQQKLTLREAEVIHLVAEGLTDKEIGVKLSISPKTVSEHVENVRGKLGATNRASAVYVFFVKMLGHYVQPG
jgi:DNA-binding NarL/FixJ family response regulator